MLPVKTGFGEQENRKGLDVQKRQQNNVKIDDVKGEKPTKEKRCSIEYTKESKTTGTCI